MLVKTFALLALSSLPVISATAAGIVADLQVLTNNWGALGSALAVPSVNVSTLLIFQSDIHAVETSSDTTTTQVVNTGPFSEADGLTILPVLQNLCSTVVPPVTSKLASDRAAFDALPLGGINNLFVADLTAVNNSTDTLTVQLIINSPLSQTNDFQTAALGCEQAVKACLAAYTAS